MTHEVFIGALKFIFTVFKILYVKMIVATSIEIHFYQFYLCVSMIYVLLAEIFFKHFFAHAWYRKYSYELKFSKQRF